MTSAMESSSSPNSDVALVILATRPSSKSNNAASPIVMAARSKCSVAEAIAFVPTASDPLFNPKRASARTPASYSITE